MNKITIIPVLFVLAGVTRAYAFGFGIPYVESYLGEPLRVSTPLMVNDQEISRLTTNSVTIGDVELFSHLNLQYHNMYSSLNVSVEVNGPSATLLISSPHRFTEPYLEVPLSIKIGDTHLVKVISVLIDPRPSQLANESPAQGLPVPHLPLVSTMLTVSAPMTNSSVDSVRLPSNVDGALYGPVARNQTLGEIAEKFLPEGATRYQAQLALWEANPEAFLHNKINNLMVGSTLRVPSASTILATSANTAKQRVLGAYAAVSVRQGVAPVPVASPVEEEAQQARETQDTQNALSLPADESPVEVKVEEGVNDRQFKILMPVSPEMIPEQSNGEFNALRSQLIALNDENALLRERLTLMERRIEELSGVVLADSNMFASLVENNGLALSTPPLVSNVDVDVDEQKNTAESQPAVPEEASAVVAELPPVVPNIEEPSTIIRYGFLAAGGFGMLLIAALWWSRSRQRNRYRVLLNGGKIKQLF
jgi:pilus assembly protein FimV